MSEDLKIALIGAGFIGRSHALAIHAVNRVYPDARPRARAYILAELSTARAETDAKALGFERWTADWQEAIETADAVVVAVPSQMHNPIVSAALDAGKPVLCEKPVGLSSVEACALAARASRTGTVNAVGFTYSRAPLVQHAKTLIDNGDLGRVLHLRGRHAEDYLADPQVPHSWRLSASEAGRFGALGDLGFHILAILRLLCGPVTELSGLANTMHTERPDGGAMRAVENEDYAAALLRFGSGPVGQMETSRLAHGRKMEVSFEVVCEGGTLAFDAERMNELRVYEAGQPSQTQGFRTILANASHPFYGGFLSAPGHQLGFNDLKTIELHAFLQGIARGASVAPDLGDAERISRICDAILDSSRSGTRITDPETYESPIP